MSTANKAVTVLGRTGAIILLPTKWIGGCAADSLPLLTLI